MAEHDSSTGLNATGLVPQKQFEKFGRDEVDPVKDETTIVNFIVDALDGFELDDNKEAKDNVHSVVQKHMALIPEGLQRTWLAKITTEQKVRMINLYGSQMGDDATSSSAASLVEYLDDYPSILIRFMYNTGVLLQHIRGVNDVVSAVDAMDVLYPRSLSVYEIKYIKQNCTASSAHQLASALVFIVLLKTVFLKSLRGDIEHRFTDQHGVSDIVGARQKKSMMFGHFSVKAHVGLRWNYEAIFKACHPTRYETIIIPIIRKNLVKKLERVNVIDLYDISLVDNPVHNRREMRPLGDTYATDFNEPHAVHVAFSSSRFILQHKLPNLNYSTSDFDGLPKTAGSARLVKPDADQVRLYFAEIDTLVKGNPIFVNNYQNDQQIRSAFENLLPKTAELCFPVLWAVLNSQLYMGGNKCIPKLNAFYPCINDRTGKRNRHISVLLMVAQACIESTWRYKAANMVSSVEKESLTATMHLRMWRHLSLFNASILDYIWLQAIRPSRTSTTSAMKDDASRQDSTDSDDDDDGGNTYNDDDESDRPDSDADHRQSPPPRPTRALNTWGTNFVSSSDSPAQPIANVTPTRASGDPKPEAQGDPKPEPEPAPDLRETHWPLMEEAVTEFIKTWTISVVDLIMTGAEVQLIALMQGARTKKKKKKKKNNINCGPGYW